MVFVIVSSSGDLMLPFIFPNGLTHTMETYTTFLEEVVLVWMVGVAAGRPCVWWLQGFTSCHTSWKSQCWLLENFCNHITCNIWLLNFLDCNPIDCYVWDIVKWDTNKTSCNTKDEIKTRTTKRLLERVTGNSEVDWRPWMKQMAISLNKSNP